MENAPVTGNFKGTQYPSTRLLQLILTSRKPILAMSSSKSPSKHSLNTSKCDLSLACISRNDDRLRPHQDYRKRFNSLSTLPIISASSWCVMDANSSHWISGHNDTDLREIASLTKIMTLIVCLDLIKTSSILSFNTQIKISYRASKMIGTTAFLRPGDKITIRNLLYALMLPSGNDAAWALAEHFGIKLSPSSIKPVRHFVAEMNKRAREMNLILTNFENPHGLMYKKNISCARDVAKMASCGLKDEDFRSIVDTKSYTAEILGQDGVIRFQNWENTNKLLGTGFCGVKTGITDNAGPCLCVAVRKSNPIVIVLLNSRSMEDRWVEAKKLSDWASSRYY